MAVTPRTVTVTVTAADVGSLDAVGRAQLAALGRSWLGRDVDSAEGFFRALAEEYGEPVEGMELCLTAGAPDGPAAYDLWYDPGTGTATSFHAGTAVEGGPRLVQHTPDPDAPGAELILSARRTPRSVDELTAVEHEQLASVIGPETLGEFLADEENNVELAEIRDTGGTLRHRLYAWNYGVSYLFPATGTDPVARSCQHDVEHWHPGQRPLFAAMDTALRRPGHGFTEPPRFCWRDDACWADPEPGAAGPAGGADAS
ncbi:hypothetical protein [Streptomyces sp. NPDC005805]|uniref:hypothetical protein n=1 Tax=Streptomyces sp. NPDC005805 TaxID=3157068 RepID=UPI0033FBC9F5